MLDHVPNDELFLDMIPADDADWMDRDYGMMAPVYRPMIVWAHNETKFILELNLDMFSLGITFLKVFPFIKLKIDNRKETLLG